ncbi:VOC family protein [Actinorugispora endophytica]|nr:VOC family protein [Actinorugispora endophytica]
MAITFNAIGIAVSDMARSLAFYRRLGLDIPAGADSEPHVEVRLDGGTRLLFDTDDVIRSFDPGHDPEALTPGGGRLGLAFACDTPAAVDSAYADLVASGCKSHLEPWDAFWGQRYAVVYDPDGNSVDLYAPLAD